MKSALYRCERCVGLRSVLTVAAKGGKPAETKHCYVCGRPLVFVRWALLEGIM